MPNIIEITDFQAPELDVYARLTENQLVNRADPANALFIAESPNVIHRALDAGCVPVSLLLERKHIEGQAKDIIARCGDLPVYTSSLEVLTPHRRRDFVRPHGDGLHLPDRPRLLQGPGPLALRQGKQPH